MADSDLIVPKQRLIPARRAFLAGLGQATLSATAVALLVGCESKAATGGQGDTSNDVAILNTALGLEYQAIAAYQVGAESGLLQPSVMKVAVQFQGQHKQHAQLLSSTVAKLGGMPVMAKQTSEYGFPVGNLKSQADVLAFAADLEKGAASAYLSAIPQFGNPDLAKAAGSILGDETMHWAVLRNALGQNPVPDAFIS